MLMLITEMLKHYCETGAMQKAGAIMKIVMRSDQIALMDRIRLTLNKFAMILMNDKDRKRLLASLSV